MDLQNFNSLFEIFATFTLAYVIIDELTENTFVSLICERILRKYKRIDEIHSNIVSTLSGFNTSINSIISLNLNDEKVQAGIPKIKQLLENVEARFTQSFMEIRSLIRENYSTKVFVYLNSYLFLYCLSVLYISGLYSDYGNKHNEYLNSSLLVLNTSSIIILLIGWSIDKKKKSSKATINLIAYNGYLFVALAFLISIVIAIFCYYANLCLLPDWPGARVILIQITIFLPISNFLIYSFKAAKRANRTLPQLEDRANAYSLSFKSEIKKVEDFIGLCNYVKGDDVSVVDPAIEK